MKLFVSIYDDAQLWPHFLRHYERFGVDEFHVAAPPELAHELAGPGRHRIVQYDDLDVAETVTGGVSAVSHMRKLAQGADEWVVIVDLDEFVEFGRPVEQIVEELEAEGANVARAIMYDRFAEDGRIRKFDEHSDLPSLFPVRARFVKNVMGGFDRKGVLVKGHLKSRGAHHVFEDEHPFSQTFAISHYKWHDPSLRRVHQALEMSSEAGLEWSSEYRKILDHYAEYGRFAWETFGGELVVGGPS